MNKYCVDHLRLVDQDHFLALCGIMVNVLVAWTARVVAAVYGLFALGLAISYSLSRSDTWRRSTEREQQEVQKGTTNQLSGYVGVSTDPIFHSMRKAVVSLYQ